MTDGAIHRVFAFEVYGLRHPSNPESVDPILLSTGELPDVGSIAPELSVHTILTHIKPEDVSGYNWSSDPRRVVGSGGNCQVTVLDVLGTWGTQLLRTSLTPTWDLGAGRIEAATTSIVLSGDPAIGAPQVDHIYWIEEEAVLVTGTTINPGTVAEYTVTIDRGMCGSTARAHRLDPSSYYAGDDGSEDRIQFDARPNFGSYLFFGALYLFRLDQLGAPIDCIKRFFYIDEPPRPRKGRRWEWNFKDIGDLLAGYQLGSADRTVTLSRRVTVDGFGIQAIEDGKDLYAHTASVYMTRYETERLLREPIHVPGNGAPSASLLAALWGRMQATSIQYLIELEAGAKWLYRILGVEVVTLPDFSFGFPLSIQLVRFRLQIFDSQTGREKGASVYQDTNGDGQQTQDEYLDGWTSGIGERVGFGKPGESAPKATLRVVVSKRPIDAFLTLCCSDDGSDAGNYNRIIGRTGPGLPISMFNLGVINGAPLTIAQETKELLERNQLLDRFNFYHISLKDNRKLGDFLAGDLCLLYCLLLGPLQSGLLTLRPWAYPRTTTPPALPVLANVEIEPGTRLPRVPALLLSSGFNPLTLEPEAVRSIRTRDAKPIRGGTVETQAVRIWQPGNLLTNNKLRHGDVGGLISGWLDLYGGEPTVLEVPSSADFLIDNDIDFLDAVSFSNDYILSQDGTGVDGEFLLLGYSFNWRTGIVTCRIIEDAFNHNAVTQTSTGTTAPVVVPSYVHPHTAGGLTIKVEVKAIGDVSANLNSAFGSAFGEVWSESGYLKASRPIQSAQGAGIGLERSGWVEAYAQIDDIQYDAGRQRTILTLTFDSSWERDGLTIGDIVVAGETTISLPDRRPAETNIEGVAIEQPPQNLLVNNNISKASGPQSYDRTLHRFGA